MTKNSEKQVIVIFGLPGSGKSYLAQNLAVKLHADYISSDSLRKELMAKATYTLDEKEMVYQQMFKRASEALINGRAVVLDGTFYKDSWRQGVKEFSESPPVFIQIKADSEVIRQRLSKKRVDSDADFAVYKLIESQFEPFTQEHLVLYSTNDNLDQMLQSAQEYIFSLKQ